MRLMEPSSDEQLYSALERFKNNQASTEDLNNIAQALSSGIIKVIPSGDSKTVSQSGGVNYGESNDIRIAGSVIGNQVINGITSEQIKELLEAIKTRERKGCSPTIIIIAVMIGLFIVIPGFYLTSRRIDSIMDSIMGSLFYRPEKTTTPTVTPIDFLTLFDGILEIGGAVIYNWDRGNWDRFPCDDGEVIEKDGKLYFSMPVNESDDWQACTLDPIISTSNIRKVSMEATIQDGIGDRGWIGMQSDCGETYLNFLIGPGVVSVDTLTDKGDFIESTALELLTALPVTRTMSAEWKGNGVIFTIEDNGISHLVNCEEPSGFELIFAGTEPGGFVEGYIDNVKIWQSEE
jgi:hypothetical protein